MTSPEVYTRHGNFGLNIFQAQVLQKKFQKHFYTGEAKILPHFHFSLHKTDRTEQYLVLWKQ